MGFVAPISNSPANKRQKVTTGEGRREKGVDNEREGEREIVIGTKRHF